MLSPSPPGFGSSGADGWRHLVCLASRHVYGKTSRLLLDNDSKEVFHEIMATQRIAT